MRQTLRLKRGLYIHFDSYKRPFLHYLRPKASRTTAIFAAATFSFCMLYGTLAPRFMGNTPTDQSAETPQRRVDSALRTSFT